MLIFIENTPRSYAWGSRHALPHMLGTTETGEPQAELWLGAHPGSPSTVAKATSERRTLIDLIQSDPERYGVEGGMLPFLLKVLAIGTPLSLQVHPDAAQAAAGFAAEERAGIALDAPERNYCDPQHKPELLVALSDVTALCGFRPIEDVRSDLQLLISVAPEGAPADALRDIAALLGGSDHEKARKRFLDWALAQREESSGDVVGAVWTVTGIARAHADAGALVPSEVSPEDEASRLSSEVAATLTDHMGAGRLAALRNLAAAHPGDPGILVSLLLHLVHLAPGQAVYLGARQLHAYLSGIAVEVMASSDNVLRAGLTQKHIDAAELRRVVDTSTLEDPRISATVQVPGLIAWQPDVPEFRLMRARVHEADDEGFAPVMSAESVSLPVPFPVVLIATEGRVRVERPEGDVAEVAIVRRGQSLYVSAGEPIMLTGRGEVFLATVGEKFGKRAGHDQNVTSS